MEIINREANLRLALELANRHGKPVEIWANDKGQVNLQVGLNDPIEPFTRLYSVVYPSKA